MTVSKKTFVNAITDNRCLRETLRQPCATLRLAMFLKTGFVTPFPGAGSGFGEAVRVTKCKTVIKIRSVRGRGGCKVYNCRQNQALERP